MSKTLSIVYYSSTQSNHLMAEAVAKGARKVDGTTVNVLRISEDQFADARWDNADILATLDKSDAIVFGAPTFMGGPAAQFKAFVDATSTAWFQRKWVNKVAGGFSVSGSPSGDKVSTLGYFQTLSNQHGMIWVGPNEMTTYEGEGAALINRFGFFGGVGAQSIPTDDPQKAEIHPGDAAFGELYGERIAKVSAALNL